MSAKQSGQPKNLADVNKQILEIKKKIQLSEGQRKAAFEEYEAARKANSDQIVKLKKDIQVLTVRLQENKDESAQYRVRNRKLETLVGTLANKTCDRLEEILDLQVIDMNKQLDLVRHKIKKKKTEMQKMASEYQMLLSIKSSKNSDSKKEKPYKKKSFALENSIHRMEVQWREADRIRKSYQQIRTSLMQDSGKFESTIHDLEEQLKSQQRDIEHLQKINVEAARIRGAARGALETEERNAQISTRVRDRQTAEYKQLVAERRLELERLERRIFQAGKAPDRPDTSDDNLSQTEPDGTPPEDQEELLKEAFYRLKETTGATGTEDVLEKFRAQKETRNRLEFLKKTTETEKHKLEMKQQNLTMELERYKYAQERQKEKNSDEMVSLKSDIDAQIARREATEEKYLENERLLQLICQRLFTLYLSMKDVGVKPSDDISEKSEHGVALSGVLVYEFQRLSELEDKEEKNDVLQEELLVEADMMIPPSYSTILKTPFYDNGHLEHMAVPSIAGSEEEDEVPTRGFLKRQAQLVIDAKSRRKNMRVPVSRK